jgi:hypothetical protein
MTRTQHTCKSETTVPFLGRTRPTAITHCPDVTVKEQTLLLLGVDAVVAVVW